MATPTAEIMWLKNGRKIPKDNHHHVILHKHSHNTVSSVLWIYNTVATDKGRYTCLAFNSVVSHKKHAYVEVSQCGMLLFHSTVSIYFFL